MPPPPASATPNPAGAAALPPAPPPSIRFAHTSRVVAVLAPCLAALIACTTRYTHLSLLLGYLVCWTLHSMRAQRESVLAAIWATALVAGLCTWIAAMFVGGRRRANPRPHSPALKHSLWNMLVAHTFTQVLFLAAVLFALQLDWIWLESPRMARLMERLLVATLPFPGYVLGTWRLTQAAGLSLGVRLSAGLALGIYFALCVPLPRSDNDQAVVCGRSERALHVVWVYLAPAALWLGLGGGFGAERLATAVFLVCVPSVFALAFPDAGLGRGVAVRLGGALAAGLVPALAGLTGWRLALGLTFALGAGGSARELRKRDAGAERGGREWSGGLFLRPAMAAALGSLAGMLGASVPGIAWAMAAACFAADAGHHDGALVLAAACGMVCAGLELPALPALLLAELGGVCVCLVAAALAGRRGLPDVARACAGLAAIGLLAGERLAMERVSAPAAAQWLVGSTPALAALGSGAAAAAGGWAAAGGRHAAAWGVARLAAVQGWGGPVPLPLSCALLALAWAGAARAEGAGQVWAAGGALLAAARLWGSLGLEQRLAAAGSAAAVAYAAAALRRTRALRGGADWPRALAGLAVVLAAWTRGTDLISAWLVALGTCALFAGPVTPALALPAVLSAALFRASRGGLRASGSGLLAGAFLSVGDARVRAGLGAALGLAGLLEGGPDVLGAFLLALCALDCRERAAAALGAAGQFRRQGKFERGLGLGLNWLGFLQGVWALRGAADGAPLVLCLALLASSPAWACLAAGVAAVALQALAQADSPAALLLVLLSLPGLASALRVVRGGGGALTFAPLQLVVLAFAKHGAARALGWAGVGLAAALYFDLGGLLHKSGVIRSRRLARGGGGGL